MVHAKNYETVSTFVIKVMQRKLLASLFSGHGVQEHYYTAQDTVWSICNSRDASLSRTIVL